MTRIQKQNLANLVLLHGYDNVCEFYGEYIADAPDPTAYPSEWSDIKRTLDGWHRHLIALADKAQGGNS